jgi:ligand-binding sensor domain-containing protein/signal transduction histidine kinase
MQDSYGFVWISTRDGLCRFDGQTCTVFRAGNKKGIALEADLIWLTYEDSKNRIWIGTKGGGLSYLNPRSGATNAYLSAENTDGSISGDIITAIFEDEENTIWVGTDGNGLNKVIPTAKPDSFYFERVHISDNTPQNLAIMDIIQHKKQVWIATYGDGIYIYDLKSNVVLDHLTTRSDEFGLSDDFVMTLAKEDSVIWAGTKFGGLNKLNLPEKIATYHQAENGHSNSLPNNFIWDINIDRSGTKWIGTYGGGLVYLKSRNNTFVQLKDQSNERSFTDNFVLNTTEDHQNQLWIATDNQGTFRFNSKPIYEAINLVWPENENPHNLIINEIYQDSRDQFWILTNSGIYTTTSDFDKVTKRRTGLQTTIFYDAIESADGRIWIATNNNLGYYDPSTEIWGEIDITSSLNTPGADRFFDLELDEDQILWIASDGGLVRFNINNADLELFKYRKDDTSTISGNKLSDLEIIGDYVWVGTDEKGLNAFNRRTLRNKRIDLSKYLATNDVSNFITDITKDPNENLLVGTADKGFYQVYVSGREIDSVQHVTINNGNLPVRIFDIEQIEEDIVISYRDGLALINGSTFESKEMKVPEAMNNSGAKELFNANGDIYFFNRSYINRINNNNIKKGNNYPKIQLTTLKAQNKSLSAEVNVHTQQKIELPYTDNFLTIAYTSLNMDPNAYYSTEYMLEGQDPFWVSGGERETVNYSNLKPGDYIFKVRYAGSPQLANETELSITITNPFWQTTWFHFLAIALFVAIIYAAARYRTYYLLKEEQTRMQIARDLHDDLSGTLSSISFFSSAAQRAENSMTDARIFLEKIDISAAEAKEKINDIIWAIDPSKDDWSVFLKKCKRYATDALDAKEIEYDIQMDDSFKIPVKLELRQNLWLIYKEMINNLVQHSEAKNAEIRFYQNEKQIVLIVKDDGVGFVKGQASSRNGISNIEERSKVLGAKLTLKTDKNEGTEWHFVYKP